MKPARCLLRTSESLSHAARLGLSRKSARSPHFDVLARHFEIFSSFPRVHPSSMLAQRNARLSPTSPWLQAPRGEPQRNEWLSINAGKADGKQASHLVILSGRSISGVHFIKAVHGPTQDASVREQKKFEYSLQETALHLSIKVQHETHATHGVRSAA